jgi:CheY-like chemotaxis protein
MATLSKRQVLVVDDDPSVRDSVARLLTSAGYDVAAAEDGLEALFQLNKVIPDVSFPTSTCHVCLVLTSYRWSAVAFPGS